MDNLRFAPFLISPRPMGERAGGGIEPIERSPQRDLERDLSRTRAKRRVGLDPLDDLTGIVELGEEPLHHRLDLRQDGLPLTPRLQAVLQRLRVPNTDGVVARTGDELLTVGPPRQRIDKVFVAAQPRYLLEGLGVPDAHIVVSPAASDALAVRTIHGAEHLIAVSDQIVQPRAGRGIPDPHDPVQRGRQDPPAVGAESHGSDLIAVTVRNLANQLQRLPVQDVERGFLRIEHGDACAVGT